MECCGYSLLVVEPAAQASELVSLCNKRVAGSHCLSVVFSMHVCSRMEHTLRFLPQYCLPYQVDALAGARVLYAACGVWHTAATASPRPAEPDALAPLGAVELRAVRQQQAVAFELLAEVPHLIHALTWFG